MRNSSVKIVSLNDKYIINLLHTTGVLNSLFKISSSLLNLQKIISLSTVSTKMTHGDIVENLL